MLRIRHVWLKPLWHKLILNSLSSSNISRLLMGKKFERKNTHSNKKTLCRTETRVLLTTCFLLREALNLDTNPKGLSDPQPLTKLDVIEFLNNVLTTEKRSNTAAQSCADLGARPRDSDDSKSSL